MSPARRTCGGTNADGAPCKSPVVGPGGYCPAHRPGGQEEMRRRARRGAEVANAERTPPGLEPDELPPLESHADAKRWLETVGRAVATGRLTDRAGQAVIRAVSEWVKAHEGELTALVVDELQEEVERLQRELGSRKRPQLRAAE